MSAIQYQPAIPRPVTPVPTVRSINHPASARRVLSARNVTVIVLAILVTMVLRLFVSVQTDANAYQIASLNNQNLNLQRDAQFLQEQLDVLNSPQHLSDVAQTLGMISNSSPAYIRLSDGRMWGNPQVVSTGLTDSTTIANSLVDTIAPDVTVAGASTSHSLTPSPESAQVVVSTTSTTGIPAPTTH